MSSDQNIFTIAYCSETKAISVGGKSLKDFCEEILTRLNYAGLGEGQSLSDMAITAEGKMLDAGLTEDNPLSIDIQHLCASFQGSDCTGSKSADGGSQGGRDGVAYSEDGGSAEE